MSFDSNVYSFWHKSTKKQHYMLLASVCSHAIRQNYEQLITSSGLPLWWDGHHLGLEWTMIMVEDYRQNYRCYKVCTVKSINVDIQKWGHPT